MVLLDNDKVGDKGVQAFAKVISSKVNATDADEVRTHFSHYAMGTPLTPTDTLPPRLTCIYDSIYTYPYRHSRVSVYMDYRIYVYSESEELLAS